MYRLRSVLTMVGILIGVAAVIVLAAVGNGTSATMESQIESLGTNLLVVSPQVTFSATGSPAAATSLDAADVRALEDRTTDPDVVVARW